MFIPMQCPLLSFLQSFAWELDIKTCRDMTCYWYPLYSCYAMLCVMIINRYHRQSSLWAHEAGYSATSGSLECNNGRLPLGTRFSVEIFFKLHFKGFSKESSNVQMLKCYTCCVFWVSCGVGMHVMPRDSYGGRGVVASRVGHLTSRLHLCQMAILSRHV